MGDDLEQLAYSKQVIEFVAVANEFCSFIEGQDRHSRKAFVESMQKFLPLVYLKAAMLPIIDEEDVEFPEKFVSEVDYHFILSKLQRKLGEHDSYLEVFDPNLQFSEGPLDASISENICDVYQDLKDFVMAYRIGNNELMAGAVWECRSHFNEYWGQKLANCLRAIHHLVSGDIDLEIDEWVPNHEDDKSQKDKNSWLSRHYESYQDDESAFNE